MIALRVFLVAVFLIIAGYTLVVVTNHGINLFPIFFGDIIKMEWPGQFNLDFMCLLLLSGLWIFWRHRFSVSGLICGLAAVVGGSLFLSAYLVVESLRVKGDINQLLVGTANTS